jgi:hypothetical protein
MLYMMHNAMACNVPHVCDAVPRLTEPRGRCGDEARRSAAEPEAPERAAHAHASRCAALHH